MHDPCCHHPYTANKPPLGLADTVIPNAEVLCDKLNHSALVVNRRQIFARAVGPNGRGDVLTSAGN